MTTGDGNEAREAPRDRTDTSLREEREEVDVRLAGARARVEGETDEAVRNTRERTDEAVEAQRLATPPCDGAEAVRSEQSEEDRLREQERAQADAVLEVERAARRRFLADFLDAERGATDAALGAERARHDESTDERNTLLASASHDLRSLLGGLALFPSVFAMGSPQGSEGDEARRHLDSMRRVVGHMNRLITDLLDFSSIETGRLQLHLETVDVSAIVRDALAALAPLAHAKGIQLVGEGTTSPIVARIDGGRLLQVLANLVGNAIKFTAQGGRVAVEVHADERTLDLVVIDNGRGIPTEAYASIFGAYQQVGRDRRGLGLGLHIAKNIVEAHAGTITVDSQVGVGTTFRVMIPLAPPARS